MTVNPNAEASPTPVRGANARPVTAQPAAAWLNSCNQPRPLWLRLSFAWRLWRICTARRRRRAPSSRCSRAIAEVGRAAADRRRPDRLRPARGSARAREGADGAAHSRWPRCSAITTSSRARPDEVRKILADAGLPRARRRRVRAARHRHRRRQGIRRRIRQARARSLGRDDHQAVRPRSGRRGAEARSGARAACARRSSSRCCTTRRSSRRSRASRSRSIRSSDRAASRSRSAAILCRWSFHGHAHRGQLEGATKNGVPVYNVSMPLLTRTFADRPPFRVFECRTRSATRRRVAPAGRRPAAPRAAAAPTDAVAS